jgi:hypothetical protein
MRPVPDFLPGANSKKWHNRRWWDSLGYLRVRTLANPDWQRDVQWLTGVLDRSRPATPGPERDQYDRAATRLRVYGGARRHGECASRQAWTRAWRDWTCAHHGAEAERRGCVGQWSRWRGLGRRMVKISPLSVTT